MQQNNISYDGTGSDRPESIPLTLVDYLEIIIRDWRMIATITIVSTVIAVILAMVLPKVYRANALIVPGDDDKGVMGLMMAQMGGLAGIAGPDASKSEQYITMLKSETVKDKIIDRFKLMDIYKAKLRSDVYVKLDGMSSFSIGKKDNLLNIAVEDRDPSHAADIANAYVDELGKMAAGLNMMSGYNNRRYLEDRLNKARLDLAEAEDAIKDFQSRNKAISPIEQAQSTILGVAQLRGQLVAQEVMLGTLQQQFTENSFEVKTAKATIANLRAQINKLEGSGGGSSSIPTVGSVPQLGQEYLRLMREFKVQETLVEILTKQYEMAKLSELKNVAPFQVLQKARVPERKSKPEKKKIVMLGFLAGLFSSTALSLMLAHFSNMQESKRERLLNLIRTAWRQVGSNEKLN